MADEDPQMEVLDNQPCPMCHKETLTLRQMDRDVPYVGRLYIFSMECNNCDYNMSDVEFEDEQKPVKLEFEVSSEEDLRVRVVKSAKATVKIPRMISIEPGPISNGYITNIEGLINRAKKVIEEQRDDEDAEKEARKKAKNMVKKLQNVLWGRETLIVQIDDPSGNSAIISDKTKRK